MTKKPLAEEQELDEKIADFADKVLSMNEEIKINDAQPGEEFLQLQKTILKMKAAARQARPDATTSARIRRNLLLSAKQENFSSNKSSENRKRFFGMALAGSFIVVALISFLFFPAQPSGQSLTGTANGISPLTTIVIVLGIILIAIFTWNNRQR